MNQEFMLTLPSKSLAMRNLLLFLMLTTILSGCKKDTNSPEAITKQFVEFMTSGQRDAAAKLGTEATARYLDFREASMETIGEDEEPIEVTSVQCFVEDDQANCLMCCDLNGEKQSITLTKQQNKWMVDINVDPLIKELEDAMSDLEEIQKEESK